MQGCSGLRVSFEFSSGWFSSVGYEPKRGFPVCSAMEPDLRRRRESTNPDTPALLDGRELARSDMQPASNPQGNPFWSERANEELRLQQMRPASLPVLDGDSVATVTIPSSSVEASASLVHASGDPVTYGPQTSQVPALTLPPPEVQNTPRDTAAVPLATPSSGTQGRLERGEGERFRPSTRCSRRSCLRAVVRVDATDAAATNPYE